MPKFLIVQRSWKLTRKEEEAVKYFRLFNDAWDNFLNELRDGILVLPWVEGSIRCYLFAECLKFMRERNFEAPYQIWAEENYGRLRADITLGSLGRGRKRVLAVEIKYVGAMDKTMRQAVEQDIRKLDEYSEHTVCGCFTMIDTSQSYKENLDLESLGLKRQHWKWRTLTSERVNPFDALIAWSPGFATYEQ